MAPTSSLGSVLAGNHYRVDAASAAVPAGLDVLVPAGAARLTGARVDVQRADVKPFDLVGIAERALEVPAVVIIHVGRRLSPVGPAVSRDTPHRSVRPPHHTEGFADFGPAVSHAM